jgi:hypothetical protein
MHISYEMQMIYKSLILLFDLPLQFTDDQNDFSKKFLR